MEEEQASIRGEGGKPAAYVTVILDETGSMQHCKGAAIAGFNEYLKALRQVPTPVRFTLTLFNSQKTDVRYHETPVAEVPDLAEATYQPTATTPLYDAVGRTLTIAGREAPLESKKLCAILTDGLENASREYTRDGIAHMIQEYERLGWTFVYLGADHDAWSAGRDLGISGDNTVQFCKRDTGQMFERLGEATTSYLSGSVREPSGFWKGTSNKAEDHGSLGKPKGGAE